MDQFNPFTLKGKRILVSGASSGIGQAIAIACSKMGASVILTGRNEQRLQETYLMLSYGEHLAIPADLTIPTEIEKLVDLLPKLDGLVQCAGVGSRIPCKMITQEGIADVMTSNFDAPVLLQSAILQKKKINKNASIVYVASRAASFPSVGNALYSASKGALLSYAKCLALELAPRQIRVNVICPGMVWTKLITETLNEEELKIAEQHYPLRRFGKVEDISNLAIYLLSDASSWMTGSSIDISGGGEGVLI